MAPNLIIQKTPETPQVNFLFDELNLFIEGESVPENPFEFYQPIIESYYNFVVNYTGSIDNVLNLTIDLQYFNTASLKMLFAFFNKIKQLNNLSKLQTIVNWIVSEEDDEDLVETIENIEEMTDVKINIKITK